MAVIALGTTCLTALALRRLGLHGEAMPFDWLATSPAMIRHCLETDFAMLLDRTQYRSLTGRRDPAEPVDGCAHDYYHSAHGLRCVFNHSDPTRESDYRYLTACIDRFRETLSSGGRTVFVQIRPAYGAAAQDFAASCALLDRLTPQGNLLQLVVNPANPRRDVPLFSIVTTQGAHTLCRMQPTSKMTGENFLGAVDREALDGLIAQYGASGRSESLADAAMPAPASVAVNLALENARLMAHVTDRGDMRPDREGWSGTPRSGLAIQGLAIHSEDALIREGISYQLADEVGVFSPSVQAGRFAGTRGMRQAVYGLRVLVTEAVLSRFRVSVEATFVDGSGQGPVVDGASCAFVADVPLEAVRLLVTARE